MKPKIVTITALMQLLLLTNLAYAMDLTPPIEYTATVEDTGKALVVIQAIAFAGRHHHLTLKPSGTNTLTINALVAAQDVELQERQYTLEKFLPFFLNQTQEEVTIKPYIPGFYTVYIPQNTQFTATTPQGTVEIDESLVAFNLSNK